MLLENVNSPACCPVNSIAIDSVVMKKELEIWQIEDADRLKRLFKLHSKDSQLAFGQKYEVGSQGMVWQYLNAHRALNLKALLAFVDGLGVRASEISPTLAKKLQPSHEAAKSVVDNNYKVAKPDIRRIPVLNKIPAGGPKKIVDDYLAGAGMEDIATDLSLGRYAFALVIDGPSMEPEFKTGDKVIIDPDVRPRPGECVAVKCNGDEGTFKKYRPRGLNANGIDYYELVPINPDFPTIRSDVVPCEIIGTMVEHRRYRRL